MSYDAVILANGEFPKKGGAEWNLLAAAKRVVACDGAADSYVKRFGKSPFAVVGDMDSLKHCPEKADIVRVPDQETNDLEKSVVWCRVRGWKKLVVVGASGKREDHLLGNVFRALDLGVEILTDYGRFVPMEGKATFNVPKDTPISIFAPDHSTHATSIGLVWPLDNVEFKNIYCATLNKSKGKRVVIASDRRIMVYIAS